MSVVVLADDFSGAVELAGVARRLGLRSTVRVSGTTWDRSESDVTCLDLNTRVQTEANARQITIAEMGRLDDLLRHAIAEAEPPPFNRIVWLFKKTDSLLRGHVATEILAILKHGGFQNCLLCPANPGRGRVVRNGEYWVRGVPLCQTMFAQDPSFPRGTSSVRQLLSAGKFAAARSPQTERQQTESPQTEKRQTGILDQLSEIVTPDVETFVDLINFARQASSRTLLAGAAEFFEAALHARIALTVAPVDAGPVDAGPVHEPPEVQPRSGTRVFVCGSPAAWASGREALARRHGIEVLTLENPAGLLERAKSALARSDRLMLAVGTPEYSPGVTSWSQQLADLAGALVCGRKVDWLFLEGGETARSVVDRLGLTEFKCFGELAGQTKCGGVVIGSHLPSMPCLVVKPGSYDWPEWVLTK